MPTCQHCQHKWSWKDGMRKAFSLQMKMTCPYCGTAQYMSAKARKKSFIFSMILQLLWFLPAVLGAPKPFTFVAVCVALLLAILLTPYILDLSSEEEALW